MSWVAVLCDTPVMILAAGIASCIGLTLEGHAAGLRCRLLLSFPLLVVVVVGLAGWVLGGDWPSERRELASVAVRRCSERALNHSGHRAIV